MIKNLDCAECGEKLEKDISAQDGIREIHINFLTERVMVETEFNPEETLILLNQRARVVEPDAVFMKVEDKRHSHDEKEDEHKPVRIVLSALLFILSLFIRNDDIKFVLGISAYLICGYDVLLKAVNGILHRDLFDENFLMSLATIGAICIQEVSEAVGVMLFYQIGEFLQDMAVDRSRRSISERMDLRPDVAHVVKDTGIIDVSPEEVNPEDWIEVYPGEKVPLDGIVVKGTAQMDTKALTGESVIREIKEEEEILSGSIVLNSPLVIKVSKDIYRSTATRILQLVEEAGDNKTQSEKFITRFSHIYTPLVCLLVVLIGIVYPLITQHTLSYTYLYRALSFLMVSCPCALVISIPLSYFCGIGGISAEGIIIKGANYLENLAEVDTLVFDKTGTLTKGNFVVTGIYPENRKEQELLEYAAYAELYSAHPIGVSIVQKYDGKIDTSLLSDVKEIANRGVMVQYQGKSILAGSSKLLNENNIKFTEANTYKSVVYLAVDNEYAGYLEIADEIKENSLLVLKKLKSEGIKKTVMLTGDKKSIANSVAEELGIDEVYSELLPADKVEKIVEIGKNAQKIAFAGDGINDAPVLKTADIGIAMGALGSDAAIEAADIVLMEDDLMGIVKAIQKAKKTKIIVRENILFAIGIKILVILLSAFGKTSMWYATLADVGVSVLCVLNSIRLIKK